MNAAAVYTLNHEPPSLSPKPNEGSIHAFPVGSCFRVDPLPLSDCEAGRAHSLFENSYRLLTLSPCIFIIRLEDRHGLHLDKEVGPAQNGLNARGCGKGM
jgi:hypothetical protein